MSLLSLQKQVLAERAKILQEIEDEYSAKEIADKLAKMHLELQALNKNLRNTAIRSKFTRKSKSRSGRATTRKTRKRVNPEFARLGIPVPPSQQVGEEIVKLGKKVKKN